MNFFIIVINMSALFSFTIMFNHVFLATLCYTSTIRLFISVVMFLFSLFRMCDLFVYAFPFKVTKKEKKI